MAAIAKFNLPGPDLTSAEWGSLLRDMPGRVVVVNTSGASFPFMADLATRGHIVITATDSAAQRYDTVFPAQLLAALNNPAADLDKNGRVSVWELFVYTARRVARHYELQGLLATERPLLDDSGDGVGIEAVNDTGTDGALARATYLEREAVEVNADAEMAALIARRRAPRGARRAAPPEEVVDAAGSVGAGVRAAHDRAGARLSSRPRGLIANDE